MFQVGDIVVTMSVAGIFEVVEINGDEVTIRSPEGIQKVVLSQALRPHQRAGASK